jgi:DNA-binding winged helix-turn-helix (wHTH) protein
MTDPTQEQRYRFGVFEADAATGELRRQGVRVRLAAQPFQVLLMLLERPGELLTREEISGGLWPDGTFVDYEHGVNSAVNRIREAIGDTASNPRFIETLARRGYRFLAPVEKIYPGKAQADAPAMQAEAAATKTRPRMRILSSPEELPKAPYPVVRTLFVLLQCMYLGFYIGALANLPEIEQIFSPLPKAGLVLNVLVVTAAILIPVRAFVLTGVIFHPPRVQEKLLSLWPLLLLFDELWALAPFLLLRHMDIGVAVACMALLAYSPFAQRSLVLMGAAGMDEESSSTLRR